MKVESIREVEATYLNTRDKQRLTELLARKRELRKALGLPRRGEHVARVEGELDQVVASIRVTSAAIRGRR